ncbi:MAG: hypothetical protein Q8N68_00260, partial [bacterium]|nr:hypothetical protein [bacterium]
MKKDLFRSVLCFVSLMLVLVSNCIAEEDILRDWLSGDGHMHTYKFSSWDGNYGIGVIGPTVLEQVKAGKENGLRWMIFTDHEEMFYSNGFFQVALGAIGADAYEKGLSKWLEEKQLCALAEQAYGIPVMLGEEVGSVIPNKLEGVYYAFLGSHGHYLGYNLGSYVFLNSYVWLPISGQNMIDAVNNTVSAIPGMKPFGIIAHPDLDAPWMADQFKWEDGVERTYDYS